MKQRCPVLRLTPPKETDPLEKDHQEMVMSLARAHTSGNPALAALFHVPNGGYRHEREGMSLQRQGVKSGVPDLLLPIPLGGYCGLAIELKRFQEGQPTPEQKAWLALLAAAGWRCALCWGWRAAWREVWRYVHLPATRELTHYGNSPLTRKDGDKSS